MDAADNEKSPRQKLFEKFLENKEKEPETDINCKHDENVKKTAAMRDRSKSNGDLSNENKKQKMRHHVATDASNKVIQKSPVSIAASEKNDLSADKKKKKKKRHHSKADPSSEVIEEPSVSIAASEKSYLSADKKKKKKETLFQNRSEQ